MKALSLSRPWPTLILAGIKPVENRTWRTHHRGPLVIHAALSWDPAAADMVARLNVDLPHGWDTADDNPHGYVGVVRLRTMHRDCVDMFGGPCSAWAFDGAWHWGVTDPHLFPFVLPGRGYPGLFTADSGVDAMVETLTGWT